jgi:hypothetical protein
MGASTLLMVKTILKDRAKEGARQILKRLRPVPSSEREAMHLWRKLPSRIPLEIVTDLYDIPALVTHKNSTAVVYANEAARGIFGDSLVGRSVQPAAAIPSGPVCFNGKPVSTDNHPGLVLEAAAPARGDVVWSTEAGNQRFVLDAQPMLKGPWDTGDFYLLTFRATA